jgi:hypothetical protein
MAQITVIVNDKVMSFDQDNLFSALAEEIFQKLEGKFVTQQPSADIEGQPAIKFLCRTKAKQRLAGGEKAISEMFFNQLRRKGFIHDYPIGDSRRVLFSVAEIDLFIASQKQLSAVLSSSKSKSPNLQ